MQKTTIDCSRLKFLVSHAEGNSSARNLSGIPMSAEYLIDSLPIMKMSAKFLFGLLCVRCIYYQIYYTYNHCSIELCFFSICINYSTVSQPLRGDNRYSLLIGLF